MARQYANPNGLFGRFITTRLLNRANKKSNEAILNALNIAPGDRVLEIGFGGGDLLFRIASELPVEELVGVEKSKVLVDNAEDKISKLDFPCTIKVVNGAIENLPCPNNYFNHIVSVNTLYFWQNIEHCADEIARVTIPGGKIVLGFSAGEQLIDQGYAEQGFRFYHSEDIHQIMGKYNLALDRMDTIDRKHKNPFLVAVYSKQ